MSRVSGVVICTSNFDEEVREESATWTAISAWLGERSFGDLLAVQDGFGGTKHSAMIVVGAGFNYFPEDEFAEFVLGRPWKDPENVVLIIQPEQGKTRVFRPPLVGP